MADIEILCDNCGTSIKISEFADPTKVVCLSCGQPAKCPDAADKEMVKDPPLPVSAKRLKTKQKSAVPETAPSSSDEDISEDERARLDVFERKRKVKIEKMKLTQHKWAWFIFAIVGLITGTLRYGYLLAPKLQPATDMMLKYTSAESTYAQFILLGICLIILLKAFKDSVFSGVLCLLIPLYNFYYLFFLSDDFYLRALIGGLLVGLGQECAIAAYDLSIIVYTHINTFISTQGG